MKLVLALATAATAFVGPSARLPSASVGRTLQGKAQPAMLLGGLRARANNLVPRGVREVQQDPGNLARETAKPSEPRRSRRKPRPRKSRRRRRRAKARSCRRASSRGTTSAAAGPSDRQSGGHTQQAGRHQQLEGVQRVELRGQTEVARGGKDGTGGDGLVRAHPSNPASAHLDPRHARPCRTVLLTPLRVRPYPRQQVVQPTRRMGPRLGAAPARKQLPHRRMPDLQESFGLLELGP